MKICIFPQMLQNKTFNTFADKLKNVHKINFCDSVNIQASSDGVWKCDNEANCLRTSKDIKINTITMQEAKTGETGSHIHTMKDFVEHENKIEYKIHPSSGITLQDIEEQKLKGHQDYGNGFTSPFHINNKPCTILILNEGVDIPENIFNILADSTFE